MPDRLNLGKGIKRIRLKNLSSNPQNLEDLEEFLLSLASH